MGVCVIRVCDLNAFERFERAAVDDVSWTIYGNGATKKAHCNK